MAGCAFNDDDEVMGAGSDDGFDAVETTEWIKNTPLLGFIEVSQQRLEDISATPIHPETGEFEEALDYPNTFPNMEKLDDELESKRCHMTASFQLNQEIRSRQVLANRIRQREAAQRLLAPPPPAPAPVEEPTWPKANCKLVPVTQAHFAQIAEMIRLEAEATDRVPQVLHSETKVKDIERVARICRDRFRPFIVAIHEPVDLTDPSKWPDQAREEYSQYMAWKMHQPKEKAVVVGFAFVTDPKIGFLNNCDPGARFVGSVRILVHPDHRRKQYGKALLDRIVRSTAPYHRSLIDYQWNEPEPGGLIYEWRVMNNQRQYSQIFVEVCTAAGDKDAKWKNRMLEFFEFEKVASFPKMLRTDRRDNSVDLDLEIWRMETGAPLLNAPPGEYLEPRG